MQNETKKDLSKYRLQRSKEMLASAKREYDAQDYLSANNRAYYCIFHAIRAVLALDGIDFKKHSAVLSTFVKNYLKPEIISREYSDLIFSASTIRNHSDYDDFYICTIEDTSQLILGAEKFHSAISDYLASRYLTIPDSEE